MKLTSEMRASLESIAALGPDAYALPQSDIAAVRAALDDLDALASEVHRSERERAAVVVQVALLRGQRGAAREVLRAVEWVQHYDHTACPSCHRVREHDVNHKEGCALAREIAEGSGV